MSIWISNLMNALCRPLVRRVSAELLPHFKQELDDMRRVTEPAIMPLVLRNEIAHMQQLPLAFFREQNGLVCVGYASGELRGAFQGLHNLIPPVRSESELSSDCLVFLDEYHFVTLIRQLPTLFVPVRRTVVLPLGGDYLPETRLRQILHQMGFPEILVMDYERVSDTCSFSGISHPIPVSSLPVMISPLVESDATTRWLVANRYPTQP